MTAREAEPHAGAAPPTASAGLKRGLWWTGRLLGGAFIACLAAAALILIELRIADWVTGREKAGSVGEAAAELLLLAGLGGPYATVTFGLLPAFAAGTLLLVAAIRVEWARSPVVWALAGLPVAWAALSMSSVEDKNAFVWAATLQGGLLGGVILRRLLSPGGRFDEASNPPEPQTALERWGYAALIGLWPIGYLMIAGPFIGSWDPFGLFLAALVPLSIAMIVAGRRKRVRRATRPGTGPGVSA
jgi:hypothetical protein